MRQDDLRPGWRSEFIRHRFDAQVNEQADCIVVRTPSNPTYYWGNCLVLPKAPVDQDLAFWLAQFDALIVQGQPQSLHVAIGVDAEYQDEALPSWRAAGFEISVNHVLRMRASDWPKSAAHLQTSGLKTSISTATAVPALLIRPMALPDEVEDIVELECLDDMPFEIEGYRSYRHQQFLSHAKMHAAGCLQWFGVWAEGVLVGCCGLLRDRPFAVGEGDNRAATAVGRFQHVLTHPQWRGRGVCTALIRAVTTYAFGHWQVAELLLLAEPEESAIRIYKRLGYTQIESNWHLQRNAPADRCA
jgi:GNAT superfamily N-acetyltransferase